MPYVYALERYVVVMPEAVKDRFEIFMSNTHNIIEDHEVCDENPTE